MLLGNSDLTFETTETAGTIGTLLSSLAFLQRFSYNPIHEDH
jgi:hypothetical protein